MTIKNYLELRYHGEGNQGILRNELLTVCTDFVAAGLADNDFTERLCSGDDSDFWSRISEALLAKQLRDVGFTPISSTVVVQIF